MNVDMNRHTPCCPYTVARGRATTTAITGSVGSAPSRRALGVVARARGMTQVAQDAGLAREALYKALRPGAQPRFDTVQRVCAALGLRLTVTA